MCELDSARFFKKGTDDRIYHDVKAIVETALNEIEHELHSKAPCFRRNAKNLTDQKAVFAMKQEPQEKIGRNEV